MLPLCFGEATKVCAYLLDADKTYRVTARLGSATTTGDADGGEVIETAEVPTLSADEWNTILQGFLGESMQIPPMYSALKKDGKRLYELARKGETVEREPRPIRIDAIELLEASGSRLVFRVTCSKGTYVRTLVEDMARAAGTVAHTARLHRETVGSFRAEDMLDLTAVEAQAETDLRSLRQGLLPPDEALSDFEAVEVGSAEAERFVGGQAVHAGLEGAQALVRVYRAGGEFLGVGELSGDGKVAPRRVFRSTEITP
jgi:tRNA pseudouridine55 synthase